MTEKRVLIVDDDDAIRALLGVVLRRRAFAVDLARNGTEALERMAKCRYSVILLDLMMPHLSGYDVLEKLKAAPRGSAPPVVVLTAGAEARDLDPEVVAATMQKPFDIEALVETIGACLAAVEARQQLEGCPPPESDRPRPAAPGRPTN